MTDFNSLHGFLTFDKTNGFTLKKDRFSSNYFLRELSILDQPSNFMLNDQEDQLVGSHLTVYETIQKDVGFGSQYHCTFVLKNHTIRLYFNEKDECIKSIIEDHGGLPDSDLSDPVYAEAYVEVSELFENIALPEIKKIRANQTIALNSLKKEYQALTEIIHKKIFEDSENTRGNLDLITHAIEKGETILRFDSKPASIKKSVTALKKTSTALQAAIHVSDTSMTKDAVTMKVEERKKTGIDETQTMSMEMSSSVLMTRTLVDDKKVKSDTKVEQFNKLYEETQQKLNTMKSTATFKEKLDLFLSFKQDFNVLFRMSLDVLKIDQSQSGSIDHRTVSLAELGIMLTHTDYEAMGGILLSECMQDEALFKLHASKLAGFAPIVSQATLSEVIRDDKDEILTFLLNHGQLSINEPQLSGGTQISHSLLNSAFLSKSLKCFTLLLQHDTNSLAPLNGLPLAHILLQLPSNDDFYNAFVQHCKPIRDGNSNFFGALSRRIQFKLTDPTLLPEEKASLSSALDDYSQDATESHGDVSLSSSAHSNIALIRRRQNPRTLQELRKSPGFKIKKRRLDSVSNELIKIYKKRHQTSALKQASSRYYAAAAQFSNENEQALQHLTLKQYLLAMDKLADVIAAQIIILELGIKPRTKDEERKYRQALNTVVSYDDSMVSSSSAGSVNNQNSSHLRKQKLEEISNDAINIMESVLGVLRFAKQLSDISGLDFATFKNYFDRLTHLGVFEQENPLLTAKFLEFHSLMQNLLSENPGVGVSPTVNNTFFSNKLHRDAVALMKKEEDPFFQRYPPVHSAPPQEPTPENLWLIIHPLTLEDNMSEDAEKITISTGLSI